MNSENKDTETMKNTSKKTTSKKTSKSKKIEITKFNDLEGKFLHVRVGSTSEPATVEQISDIQDKVVGLFEKHNINCMAFVTHHAVFMEIIEKDNND